ncbi:hypothetical protein SAMN05444365_107159 [Micromonospora pattaloongensis]|uniref:Uncharacterized protein n=1 Tax=Micromonospora pattaloongensis TaxID=405436 RepID=A0A1H3R9V6_9ACTN|nr:hypothetical protein [Micromonospora pattaloongensis]SDZ22283.1 hypothetical protein SAMN05444365_107159 [Micromonospora pattaloongensis]
MPQIGTRTLSFEVAGLPPLKNEGLSMLAAGHRQAGRVRALLQAACTAAQRSGWTPLAEPVSLDVVLRCPPGHPSGDASNFLGGIGDVLQDKRRARDRSLAHLGVLVDVALYTDDRQIRQISYREEAADEPSYLVRIAALSDSE